MEKANLARTSKPQRPALSDYILGKAKLEDLVDRNKLIKPDHMHTNRRALLASVNSINKTSTSHRKAEEKYVKHGQPHSGSASSSEKSRRRTEKMSAATTTSSSLRSERSAQGDMTESNASTSTRASVIIDRELNEKETQIRALTAEIERLKQASNARREQEMVSHLQKLFEDLPSEDPQLLCDPSDFDNLVERLSKAVRTMRESHETFARVNAEKEKKLALVRDDNDTLQKTIESLQSDLRKMAEQNEEHNQQLASIRTQNDRLNADLESTRRKHATGVDMCTNLQTLITDKFQNETNKLQNYEKTLHDRVDQLEHEFEKLENACQQHVQWLDQIPRDQIESLKAELHETELAKMQQVCEVTALYSEQVKQLNELRRINQQLLEESHRDKTFLKKLHHENRKLETYNQYLQQQNEALQEACQKKIQSMTGPLKEETLAKLNRRSLDAEMAYSKELQKQADETIRVTRGSSEH